MHPEIFSFGPFTIHSYGFFVALGVFLSLYLMQKTAAKHGFPPSEKVFDLIFVTVVAGFLGARIFYVVQEWSWYRDHPLEMIQIWKGGLVFYGGMIVAFIVVFIYAYFAKLSLLSASDLVVVFIPLGHAFGRIGCFFNGCCYGKFSKVPWAVQFPFLSSPVHPTQLYETIFNFGLFGFLSWFYPRRRFPGEVSLIYILFYSVGRFIFEFYRGDQPHFAFSLTFQQLLSSIFISLGILTYGICRLKRR